MNAEDRNANPYLSPHPGNAPRFQWKRVPFGLYCGYRGYVKQMQKDGGSLVGHLVCWAGILFFGLLLTGLFAMFAQPFFLFLAQYLR